MAKTGTGALTDADKANLLEIQDHTDEVIAALGTAIARGLEAIGIEAESDAAAICPVDTGRLRNSITHTLSNDGKAAIIGTNIEYAEYVHNGTHNHKAQPFLTDAINQNADKYRRILKASMSG